MRSQPISSLKAVGQCDVQMCYLEDVNNCGAYSCYIILCFMLYYVTIGSFVCDIYVCIRTHRHFMSHMTSILTEIQYIGWCKKTGKVLRNLQLWFERSKSYKTLYYVISTWLFWLYEFWNKSNQNYGNDKYFKITCHQIEYREIIDTK